MPPYPLFREEARRILGDKPTRLCDLARGEIIVHWDDDDWHAPDRLARQLAAIETSGADIVGLAQVTFLADDGARAWDYRWGGRQRWVYGASMAYRRDYWLLRRFPAIPTGEDTRFVLDARGAHVQAMSDADWLVARVHDGNTSPKRTRGGYWTERPPGPLLERLAEWAGGSPPIATRPLANVYALLAHERPECVVDLVRNLRWHDSAPPRSGRMTSCPTYFGGSGSRAACGRRAPARRIRRLPFSGAHTINGRRQSLRYGLPSTIGSSKLASPEPTSRPPTSTGPDRSYAGSAWVGSCASTIARRPETPDRVPVQPAARLAIAVDKLIGVN